MHVTTGVIYLGVILSKVAAGKYMDNPHSIEVCGLFWHFVDLIWILVFTFVYLIP
jgi:heme/copper-type cytochrome/quinol oxidase subunit 3